MPLRLPSLSHFGTGGGEMVEKNDDEKFCGECGRLIRRRAELCPNCGVRQWDVRERRNKGVATLFCFFLGGFGAHKFYLGQMGRGICYLLFCWTCVPAVIAFIEFILLTLMPERVFYEKFG